ncbi:transglutaminase TgpA family protein [Haloterrigena alkaliphila]|uniref:DUF4129 domain-containing protein n=1 Tax=Haloterrigena alkaliphila TaxID=2816475 RepID=A0A8A2VJD4_9EURY|nr:DUF3488 and transglutaminase-like domain-containing protein [Haloterrigena alkaliphila]QSX00443.1 transglutaminaseTgpA domain-containing protein [Haloterrigena alkaliphila]
MSNSKTHAGDRTVAVGSTDAIGPDTFRLLACCCVLVLTASYVSVLREVTRVVGGTDSLFALVGVTLVAATLLAWTIRPRTAAVLAVVAATVGFAYYLESSGVGVGVALSASGSLVTDTLALVSGLPLLRMVEAGVWALAFAPAPVFLSWYLALRGRYGLAVVPGSAALVFLVLTGDAETAITLLGTLAAIGAVGFGELERRGGSVAQADLLAVLFALIIVLSLSITFVPGGTGRAQFDSAEPGTLEGTIDYTAERSGIGGSVELSPEVRFTVQSERPSYWRTGVYDRFTGDEWVRTGDHRRSLDALSEPPGEYDRVEQIVTAETDLGVMPAAPHPIAVDGELAQHTEVSRYGGIQPATPVLEGDSYAVESAVIDPDAQRLRVAGTNYPDGLASDFDYFQTPEGLSSEFERRTDEITADADNPYDEAVAIESHLRTSKEYSLEVDRPDGNVAEAFLLEMEEGYCVYFATTMVQMLRAEDIPARYVTGYTTGQQIGEDEYLVRGTDAHAWVEVYFPDHGWVSFDPTPASSRADVHTDRVEQARSAGNEDVDTDSSADEPLSEPNDEGPSDPDEPVDPGENGDPAENGTDPGSDDPNGTNGSDRNGSDPPGTGSELPGSESDSDDDEGYWSAFVEFLSNSQDALAIALVVLVGVVASVHRTAATRRLRRRLGRYWQRPTDDPDRDVERATRRLERLLADEYRPRRRSESIRSYLESLADEPERSLDPRAMAVLERYERAVYGGGVDRAEADEAIEIVDDLARERLPVVGRRRNSDGLL